MSGHSKWATIKHKKGALDAKRGKIFTRCIKEIMIAARSGGDPGMNPRLRTAVAAAKAVSMPADNIKRAIMRGTGELEGGQIDEIMFEGYGPGGAAVLVMVATDNRNRTVSDIRHIFSKQGGNLGEQGSVAWMFERKSEIVIDGEKATEDQLMALALDAGAEDLRNDGGNWVVVSPPESHDAVLEAIQKAGIATESAEIGMVPKNLMKLEGKNASGMLRLSEALEENDDVQNVYSNFDIDEKEMEAPRFLNCACPGDRLRNRAHRLGRHRERRPPASRARARRDPHRGQIASGAAPGDHRPGTARRARKPSARCGRRGRSLLFPERQNRSEAGACARSRAAGDRRGSNHIG